MRVCSEQEYRRFMIDEENEYNCDLCPENHNFQYSNRTPLPCGQQHCWVVLTQDAIRNLEQY